MADPDTVRVNRDITGKLTVSEVEVGKKAVKIVMDKGELLRRKKSRLFRLPCLPLSSLNAFPLQMVGGLELRTLRKTTRLP